MLVPFQVRSIGFQLLCLSKCLAHLGIEYRDWHPDALYMDAEGVVKVADFGQARPPTPEAGPPQRYDLDFRPPEVVLGHPPVQGAPDVWAIACVLYFLVTGAALWGPGLALRQGNAMWKAVQERLQPMPVPTPAVAVALCGACFFLICLFCLYFHLFLGSVGGDGHRTQRTRAGAVWQRPRDLSSRTAADVVIWNGEGPQGARGHFKRCELVPIVICS